MRRLRTSAPPRAALPVCAYLRPLLGAFHSISEDLHPNVGDRSVAGADLDAALTDPGLVAGLRCACGAAGKRAVRQVEDAGMPGTRDPPILERALVQRSSCVAAPVRKGQDGAAGPIQQDVVARDADQPGLAVHKLAVVERRGPLLDGILERGVIHADASPERQVAPQEGCRRHDRSPGVPLNRSLMVPGCTTLEKADPRAWPRVSRTRDRSRL